MDVVETLISDNMFGLRILNKNVRKYVLCLRGFNDNERYYSLMIHLNAGDEGTFFVDVYKMISPLHFNKTYIYDLCALDNSGSLIGIKADHGLINKTFSINTLNGINVDIVLKVDGQDRLSIEVKKTFQEVLELNLSNKIISFPFLKKYKGEVNIARVSEDDETFDIFVKLAKGDSFDINGVIRAISSYVRNGKEKWKFIMKIDSSIIPIKFIQDYSGTSGAINSGFNFRIFKDENDELVISTTEGENKDYNKVKVCVIGTCFAKQAFHAIDFTNIDYKRYYNNECVIFHTTIESMMSKPYPIKKEELKTDNQEFKRLMELYGEQEFKKDSIDKIKSFKPNYIVIDLFTESHASLFDCGGGSYVTDSFFLNGSLIHDKLKNSKRFIKPIDEERFILFENSLKRIKEVFRTILPLENIILVKARSSINYLSKDGNLISFDNPKRIIYPNNCWSKYNDMFLSIIPECRCIDLMHNDYYSIGDDCGSPFTLSPNHLQSEYYKDVLNSFNRIVLQDFVRGKKPLNVIDYVPSEKKNFVFEKEDFYNPHTNNYYLFSIIVAVHNSEKYLESTIESVLSQTFNFKDNVQLILVNDGSTDGSLIICKKYASLYPNNILVINKSNGGVSSARNVGMLYALGKYINFLDSDDQLSLNTLEDVYKFFKENEEYVDVVSVRNELFGEKNGDSWFNNVYRDGNRLINLWKEPQLFLNSVNNSFFHSRIANQLHFDESISISEDLKVVNTVLLNKYHIGVLNSCFYKYRITHSLESLSYSARTKEDWYFPYLTNVALWLFNLSKDKCGFIPKFIQYTLLRDLFNRFDNKELVLVVPEKERDNYKKLLFSCFQYIDDDVICNNSFLNNNWKIYFLSIKHDNLSITSDNDYNVLFSYGGETTVPLKLFVYYNFFSVKGDEVTIEGYIPLPAWNKKYNFNLKVKCGNNTVNTEIIKRVNNDNIAFDKEVALTRNYFKTTIRVKSKKKATINIYVEIEGKKYLVALCGYGPWFPLTKSLERPVYYSNGILLTADKEKLILKKASFRRYLILEDLIIEYLETIQNDFYAIEYAEMLRLFLNDRKSKRTKEKWIISDRHVAAGDNGEALYKYLLSNNVNNDVDLYFAIDKTSADYHRLASLGFNVVDFKSLEYKKIFVVADKIISSYMEQSELNPFKDNSFFKEIIGYKNYIFLQHGITKDDLSGYYSRKRMPIDLFITTTKKEFESIVSNNAYLCGKSITKLTGLARYDLLSNDPKKVIVLMPTWRNNQVVFGIDGLDAIVNKNFADCHYYRFYHKFLKDKRLVELLKKYGYVLKYFPHNNMIPTNEFFKDVENDFISIVEGNERNYSQMFKEASVMITDYSSTAFDFAYLVKPIIYCQGDEEEFFNSHTYTKGYFSYRDNGFGPIVKSIDSLLEELEAILIRGSLIDNKYLERINNFYSFKDKNNSKRIYEEIVKLKRRF